MKETTNAVQEPALNWLALVQYGWKGNDNPTSSSQSSSCELFKINFGYLA